jgi:HK97 family phage major capsid protein
MHLNSCDQHPFTDPNVHDPGHLGWLRNKKAPDGFVTRPIVDLTESQARSYSLVRAIKYLLNDHGSTETADFELEVSDEIARVTGRMRSGIRSIFVPTMTRSGLSTLTSAAGGFAVQTSVPSDMIELLRQQTRLFQLGAQMFAGLRNSVSFLVEASATAANWVADNPGADSAATDPSFSAKTLGPKMLTSTTSFTRKLMQQSSVDIESMIRRDIAKSHAIAIDQAGISGTGAGNQPLGITGTAGIGNVAIGANGGAPSYATICALEQAIGDGNADDPQVAFLSTPTMRNKLRNVFKNGTGSGSLWDDDGVIGYRAAVSKAVPSALTKGTSSDCHAIIAGNFSELFVGEFGAFEICVDPFTSKKRGVVEVTSYQMCDILVRQPTAFAVCLDARNV